MKFENSALSDGGSYEKPAPGKYIGIIVGFAYVGTQPGNGQYAARPHVILRWELHKRKGPSKDSKDFVHTVTALYGATVRGENSKLRKAIEAHGLEIPENGKTDSHDWLGRAAWLDLEDSDSKKYCNVATISKLDPEDDTKPDQVLASENWEGDPDEGLCPGWAAYWVSKSTDLSHRAPAWAAGKAKMPPASNGTAATAVATFVAADDDEIPF